MRQNSDHRLRKEIAHQAAKLLAIDGIDDYLLAKKKAASQLGIIDKNMLPTNLEIEQALVEYQSIFRIDEQQSLLLERRKTTVKIMELLENYQPRLVGSLLKGTASDTSEIVLHVFSDTPEFISLFLEQEGIPATICERRIKLEKEKHRYFSSLKFLAGELCFVLIIFPLKHIKSSPIDPVTGSSMERAKTSQVKKLITVK